MVSCDVVENELFTEGG